MITESSTARAHYLNYSIVKNLRTTPTFVVIIQLGETLAAMLIPIPFGVTFATAIEVAPSVVRLV